MAKMFLIGGYVLREAARTLDRDKNIGRAVLKYEPLFGEPILYERQEPVTFALEFQDDNIWDAVKNAGTDPLIEMIDAEVVRYRAEKEAFVDSEGVPAPYPQIFPEVVEFLCDKEYTVVIKD
jgi:hypothetical protein